MCECPCVRVHVRGCVFERQRVLDLLHVEAACDYVLAVLIRQPVRFLQLRGTTTRVWGVVQGNPEYSEAFRVVETLSMVQGSEGQTTFISFHRNFSSSVSWMTSGTLNVSARTRPLARPPCIKRLSRAPRSSRTPVTLIKRHAYPALHGDRNGDRTMGEPEP